MIKRVNTTEGECIAIVFEKTDSFEDISLCANGLIDLMITATDSDIYSNANEAFYSALKMLKLMMPTEHQINEFESYLNEKNKCY